MREIKFRAFIKEYDIVVDVMSIGFREKLIAISDEDVVIGAGETKVVGLGIAIDDNFFLYEIGSVSIGNSGEVYAPEDCNERVNDFMKSHYIQLSLRSSLGKKGLIMPHGVGVVDLDYRDEIKMIIHNPYTRFSTFNNSERGALDCIAYNINKGDKIGQITLLEHKSYLFGIDTDEERVGGFGSTGE